jgi:hypothetical protein
LLCDGKNKIITEKCTVPRTHHLVECNLTDDLWYHDAQFLVSCTSYQDKLSEQHHNISVLHSELRYVDDYEFHRCDDDQLSETCTVTKGRYKFGNLEIFCLYNRETCSTGQWIPIPHSLENDYIDMMYNLHIKISGSRDKFVKQLFLLF